MGAYGSALIAFDQWCDLTAPKPGQEKNWIPPKVISNIATPEQLDSFKVELELTRCGGCQNNCLLTINTFTAGNDKRQFITGNRCEKGLERHKLKDTKTVDGSNKENTGVEESSIELPNLFDWKYKRLFNYYVPLKPEDAPMGSVGIPRVLNMYENYPLWFTVFTKLGFQVKLSPRSNKMIYERGIDSIPSESVCYPAKISHGHLESLLKMGCKFIFYPCIPYERDETPEDLKKQFPVAKKILNAMGIKYFELAGYEADDIIGTIAAMADKDPEFDATIVSSDRDLLQLISDVVDVKLLKQKGFIRYNKETFKDDYGIEPIRIIDLKALSGDASDNVPGVKGIGEKTALKLLQEYGTLENIYANIDLIKGATHERLVNDRDSAFFSKDICTIYREVPLEDTLDNMKYIGRNDSLDELFADLEFYSFLKKVPKKQVKLDVSFKELSDVHEINIDILLFIIFLSPTFIPAEILIMNLRSSDSIASATMLYKQPHQGI